MYRARRLQALSGYAFAELDALRDERRAAGADVIDFGVGDPTDPTPESVVAAASRGLVRHRRSGYPSYTGRVDFRAAAADWILRRHGVQLDPERQVSATQGSKEAIFHLPGAVADPGDVVLVPSPGYPPYARGARYVGALDRAYAVLAAGPLLPDLEDLPGKVSARLRVVWITQPHVPTGRFATLEQLQRLAGQTAERGALLCSDEAYCELYSGAAPASVLQVSTSGTLAFHSLSKRSAMTGYRVGFVAGDERAVAALRSLKTNIDSGTPDFIQDAAIAALFDEAAARQARRRVLQRAQVLVGALRDLGCTVQVPEAGFYLWVATPGQVSGVAFARRLLGEEPALATLPGEWMSDPVPGWDQPPGAGYVRFALVPSLARCREAARRLGSWSRVAGA